MSVDQFTRQESEVREASTADSLGHAFCVRCYPVGGAVIVSLCGALWDGQPISQGAAECTVCDTFGRCPRCGVVFHKPWEVA